MKYEFHLVESTTKVNLEKIMFINLLISYKYKYKKLHHYPYRNLEYESLKLKFNSTTLQATQIKEKSNILDQESNMQIA
jgi:hypothetical protein